MTTFQEVEQLADELLLAQPGSAIRVEGAPAAGQRRGSVLITVTATLEDSSGTASIVLVTRGGLSGETLARSASGKYASALEWSDTPVA